MRLALVFLPEESVQRSCEELSRQLVGAGSARATLGPRAIPHVTLAHAETDHDPAEIWASAARRVPATIALDVQGLAVLPYGRPYNAAPSPVVGTIGWLCVLLSQELRRAEEAALATFAEVGAEVTTRNGQYYNPHVTLAVWDGAVDPTVAMASPLLSALGVPGRLALGRVGPHGILESIVGEAR